MAKRISIFEKRYTDVEYVQGVYENDNRMQEALFRHCKRYFDDHYKTMFFEGDAKKDDIFQDSYITFWEIIENKRIYVEDGVLKGKKGERLSCSLTTYFMGIARMKYKEQTRQSVDEEEEHEWEKLERGICMALYSAYEQDDVFAMLDIIDECLSKTSKKCNLILTSFYYERKSLADILPLVPDVENVHSLRTAKYNCMNNLRVCSRMMYERYLYA